MLEYQNNFAILSFPDVFRGTRYPDEVRQKIIGLGKPWVTEHTNFFVSPTNAILVRASIASFGLILPEMKNFNELCQ